VVADGVDDGELLVVIRLAEAPAELLEPQDPGLRGPQHEDRVELGEVEALVALRQLVQRLGAGGGGVAAMKSACLSGDAEGQRARAAALLELLVGVSGARLRRDVPGQLLLVEAGVAPGDRPVVHLVRDAEVAEAAEEVLLDALDEVAAVDEVLLAESEEVAAVGPLGGGAMANASRGKRSRWATRPRVWIEAKRTSASSSRSSPL
jgi:hypothetical protein